MLLKRKPFIWGSAICLFIVLLALMHIGGAQSQPTTQAFPSQVLTNIDEILKKNPLKAGEKNQLIKIAEDETITLAVVRSIGGPGLKKHIHKTHNEMIYVVSGSGQIFVDDEKSVDVKPGNLHFNPMGKVHTSRPAGDEPFVIISVFTPALKAPDREFVE